MDACQRKGGGGSSEIANETFVFREFHFNEVSRVRILQNAFLVSRV